MPGSSRGAGGGTSQRRWVLLLIAVVGLALVDNWRLRIRTRGIEIGVDATRVTGANHRTSELSESTAAASSTATARTVGKSGGEVTVRTQVVQARPSQRKPGSLRKSKEHNSTGITNQHEEIDTTEEKTPPKSPEEFDSTTRENSRTAGILKQRHNQTDTATSRLVGSPTSQYAGPTFVFFIGLEGSGHHLIDSLMMKSPSQNSLGMRSCIGFKKLHEDMMGSMVRPTHKPEHADPSAVFVNATNRLRYIREDALKHMDEPYNEQLFVSINCNGCRNSGLLSYPDFLRPQRELQYVNLHSFYRMCQEAETNCRHAFIYRDPLQIVRSTTLKRHFNPTKLAAIRLYTMMYQVIHSQLVMFRQYNLGCFGFIDPVGARIDEDWRRFASLFGWDISSFRSLMNETVTAPSNMTQAQLDGMNVDKLHKHMKTFVDIHNQVVDYCYETLDAL